MGKRSGEAEKKSDGGERKTRVGTEPGGRGGAGGVLRRLLSRRRWERMGGMSPEDAERGPLPPPAPRRDHLSHRLSGVKAWTHRPALLQDGALHLFSPSSNPLAPPTAAEYRINLGMCIVQFCQAARKVDIELGSGLIHHLAFPSRSRHNFEDCLLSLYLHRVQAQVEFIRGSGLAPLGSAYSSPHSHSQITSSSIISKISADLNNALAQANQTFRQAKTAFLNLRTRQSQKSKKSFRNIFRSKSKPRDKETEELMQTLETLMARLEGAANVLEAAVMESTKTSSDPPIILVRTGSEEPMSEEEVSVVSTTSEQQTEEDPLDLDSDKEETATPSQASTTQPLSQPSSRTQAPSQPPSQPPKQPLPPPVSPSKQTPSLRRTPPLVQHRTELPAKMPTSMAITVSVVMRALRDNSLPLRLFEPMTSLQRLSEQMDYAALLDKAVGEGDAVLRMGLVAGFIVANLAHTHNRTAKPFNPLLGETFALDRWEESGWRFLAEQVQHSPDVSACAAEGRSGWSLSGSLKIPRPSLGFSYVSIHTSGSFVINLLGRVGETYSYAPIECRVTNPVSVEKRRLHHVGTVEVVCSSGLRTTLRFTPGSVQLEGEVKDPAGRSLATLDGTWTEAVRLSRPRSSGAQASPSPTTVFLAHAAPEDAAMYYNLGLFSRQLNEAPRGTEARSLPPTDSRFRPDVRAFEEGRLLDAQAAKESLEKGQRLRRKAGKDAPVRWFTLPTPTSSFATWSPNRRYWPAAAIAFHNTTFIPPLFNTN